MGNIGRMNDDEYKHLDEAFADLFKVAALEWLGKRSKFQADDVYIQMAPGAIGYTFTLVFYFKGEGSVEDRFHEVPFHDYQVPGLIGELIHAAVFPSDDGVLHDLAE